MSAGKPVVLPIKRAIAFLIRVVLAASILLPLASQARAQGKTIRIGWHEPPYFMTDSSGRRSGYSYEYIQKIAAYTGWNYEYVEGSWSELLQMLKQGEIDLMGNISYMEERTREMLYTSIPMGTESYYVFVAPNNTEITPEDYSSLNGKRIGVAKGSIQSDLFREWARAHGVRVELVELTTPEEASLLLLGTRQLDAFVTMDVYADPEAVVPIWKIGSSDFFFALSNNRSDLLAELNNAMSRIQDEDKYYNQYLYDKYLKNTETNLFLSTEEKEWLRDHGTLRVGYQDNYLAFCARDESTGELTGALKDYLDYAFHSMENAHLEYEAVSYPTAADAIEALQNGEVDCVFPANLTAYDVTAQ